MTTPFGRLRAGSRLRIPLAVTTSSTRITVTGGAATSLVGEITRPGGVHQLT